MNDGGLKAAGIPRDRRPGDVPISCGSRTDWTALLARRAAENKDDEDDMFLSRSRNLKLRHPPLALHKETSSNTACNAAAELPAMNIEAKHHLNSLRNTPVPERNPKRTLAATQFNR